MSAPHVALTASERAALLGLARQGAALEHGRCWKVGGRLLRRRTLDRAVALGLVRIGYAPGARQRLTLTETGAALAAALAENPPSAAASRYDRRLPTAGPRRPWWLDD